MIPKNDFKKRLQKKTPKNDSEKEFYTNYSKK